MTNREFAAEDEVFRRACQLAGIEPTVYQARKWRHHIGRAHEFKQAALEVLRVTDGVIRPDSREITFTMGIDDTIWKE